MDLDFEDYLGADLPFIRTNPNEEELVDVIELDGTGAILDVVTTNPCHLGALEDDYYLEPIIDDTTYNMPFEMSELHSAEEGDYLDDVDELGVSIRGRASIKGLYGKITPRKKKPAKKRPAKKKSRIQLRTEARARRRAKIKAKKQAILKQRRTTRAKLAPAVKLKRAMPIRARAQVRPLPQVVARPLPQVIARPKLATAGVTCGCAQIGRIETMLKKAATQRSATSEHRFLIKRNKFRRRTVGQLRAILGRLNFKDRSKVIRAACGMGGS